MPQTWEYRAPLADPVREPKAMTNQRKHFKARVENPWTGCHAMELWLEGPSILSVGNGLVDKLSELGVDESKVTKLIEIDDDRERLWLSVSTGRIVPTVVAIAIISVQKT